MQKKQSFTYSNPAIVESEDNLPETCSNKSNLPYSKNLDISNEEQNDSITDTRIYKINKLPDDRDYTLYDSHNDGALTEPMSFTTQLEVHCKRRDVDIERSEGYSVDIERSEGYSADIGEDSLHAWNLNESGIITTAQKFPEDIFYKEISTSDFKSEQCLPDVWAEAELEEAFGIYNLNAFYSYGSTSPVSINICI